MKKKKAEKEGAEAAARLQERAEAAEAALDAALSEVQAQTEKAEAAEEAADEAVAELAAAQATIARLQGDSDAAVQAAEGAVGAQGAELEAYKKEVAAELAEVRGEAATMTARAVAAEKAAEKAAERAASAEADADLERRMKEGAVLKEVAKAVSKAEAKAAKAMAEKELELTTALEALPALQQQIASLLEEASRDDTGRQLAELRQAVARAGAEARLYRAALSEADGVATSLHAEVEAQVEVAKAAGHEVRHVTDLLVAARVEHAALRHMCRECHALLAAHLDAVTSTYHLTAAAAEGEGREAIEPELPIGFHLPLTATTRAVAVTNVELRGAISARAATATALPRTDLPPPPSHPTPRNPPQPPPPPPHLPDQLPPPKPPLPAPPYVMPTPPSVTSRPSRPPTLFKKAAPSTPNTALIGAALSTDMMRRGGGAAAVAAASASATLADADAAAAAIAAADSFGLGAESQAYLSSIGRVASTADDDARRLEAERRDERLEGDSARPPPPELPLPDQLRGTLALHRAIAHMEAAAVRVAHAKVGDVEEQHTATRRQLAELRRQHEAVTRQAADFERRLKSANAALETASTERSVIIQSALDSMAHLRVALHPRQPPTGLAPHAHQGALNSPRGGLATPRPGAGKAGMAPPPEAIPTFGAARYLRGGAHHGATHRSATAPAPPADARLKAPNTAVAAGTAASLGGGVRLPRFAQVSGDGDGDGDGDGVAGGDAGPQEWELRAARNEARLADLSGHRHDASSRPPLCSDDLQPWADSRDASRLASRAGLLESRVHSRMEARLHSTSREAGGGGLAGVHGSRGPPPTPTLAPPGLQLAPLTTSLSAR